MQHPALMTALLGNYSTDGTSQSCDASRSGLNGKQWLEASNDWHKPADCSCSLGDAIFQALDLF